MRKMSVSSSIVPSRFGRLDVAVNNAGTEGKRGAATEQTAESYATTFDTNVLGVVLSLKHELGLIYAQKAGIIDISSSCGHKGAAGASRPFGSLGSDVKEISGKSTIKLVHPEASLRKFEKLAGNAWRP
jgi:NAD(P)-dependent dehydrogenase (short-subunit alcohol dehydrogenase family)